METCQTDLHTHPLRRGRGREEALVRLEERERGEAVLQQI